MNVISFGSQIDILRKRLNECLPGTKAHLTMAPAYRNNPDQLTISDKPCRSAGVLAVLFPTLHASAGVLLTKRREDLPEHAGQISFPGGRQEKDETLVQTALRETEEEIGLEASRIDVIGQLSPLYIPISNYCVHPFVGILEDQPEVFRLQESEVQSVLQLSISELASPQTRQSEFREIHGKKAHIPFFYIEREIIWGATAMILAELLMVLEEE